MTRTSRVSTAMAVFDKSKKNVFKKLVEKDYLILLMMQDEVTHYDLLILSLAYSLTHWLTHSPSYLLTHPLTYSLVYSLPQSPTLLLTLLLTYLFSRQNSRKYLLRVSLMHLVH
jgi:hypothetical protein